MSKNILVLNGDPLYTGKAAALGREFMKGATSVGKDVTDFYLEGLVFDSYIDENYDERVNPNVPQSQYDDMGRVYPVYKEAEVVALVSPQYNWFLSSQLLAALDRLFAIAHNDPTYTPGSKKFVLIMTAEGNDFSAVDKWYDTIMARLKIEDGGKIYCGKLKREDNVKERAEMQAAFDLGQNV